MDKNMHVRAHVGGRCEVLCLMVSRLAHIRGKMRKKVWVGAEIILVFT